MNRAASNSSFKKSLDALSVQSAAAESPFERRRVGKLVVLVLGVLGVLLLAVRALAEHEGVAAALTEEWGLSQPGLAERCSAAARGTAPKAWRFVGEMQEIADTFAAAELPRGFHEAAADVYRRLAGFRDAEAAPDAVIRRLLDGSG